MFLDIGLPGMDGYEVVCWMRDALGDACPRLVALTGYGRPEDINRSLAAGFWRHLTKPVDRHMLLALFRELAPTGAEES